MTKSLANAMKIFRQAFPSRPPRTQCGRHGSAGCGFGFTLIEMLTTVTVLAVALSIAAPGLGGFVRSSQLSGTQTELASSMVLARSEAIKRGARVALAASAPASGAEFSNGWAVWVDANANGAIDTGESVIRQYPSRKSTVVSTAGGETTLAFQPSGFVVGTTGFTFRICGADGAPRGYRLTLDPVGLADVQDTTCP